MADSRVLPSELPFFASDRRDSVDAKSVIWIPLSTPANLWGCFVVAVAFREDKARSNRSMFERRLIRLIYAGRNRIILIIVSVDSLAVFACGM